MSQHFKERRINSAKIKGFVDAKQIKIDNRKGRQFKLCIQQYSSETQQTIHKQNLLLLMKMHKIDCQKKNKKDDSFHLESLNIKNRIDNYKKIQNQNNQIIKRLRSQKSRYSSNTFQQQFKRNASMSKSIRKSYSKYSDLKNQNTSFNNIKSAANDFQMLPQPIDGFNDRLIIYTQILTIRQKSCHLQISKSNSFYYVLLQQFSNQRYFKLRLIINTGDHLINLIKNNLLNFSERIIKKGSTYILTIPYFPFVRSFTFVEFRKNTYIAKTQEVVGNKEKTYESQYKIVKKKLVEDQKDMFLKQFEESIHLGQINYNNGESDSNMQAISKQQTQNLSNYFVQKNNHTSQSDRSFEHRQIKN